MTRDLEFSRCYKRFSSDCASRAKRSADYQNQRTMSRPFRGATDDSNAIGRLYLPNLYQNFTADSFDALARRWTQGIQAFRSQRSLLSCSTTTGDDEGGEGGLALIG